MLSACPSVEDRGTLRSAMTSMEESFPAVDTHILVSEDGNLTTIAILAAARADAGSGPDEILVNVQVMIPRARTSLLATMLEYLCRGSRFEPSQDGGRGSHRLYSPPINHRG